MLKSGLQWLAPDARSCVPLTASRAAVPLQAAECIAMIAKLGEPTESLQVGCLFA